MVLCMDKIHAKGICSSWEKTIPLSEVRGGERVVENYQIPTRVLVKGYTNRLTITQWNLECDTQEM